MLCPSLLFNSKLNKLKWKTAVIMIHFLYFLLDNVKTLKVKALRRLSCPPIKTMITESSSADDDDEVSKL